jgi:putative glutamine amidotransferase
MQSRPTIGVPAQTLQAIDDIPAGLPISSVMNHRYFEALALVGAVPWMIPLIGEEFDTLRASYERLDGIFIAGGVDVDPSSYCQDRHELCGRTDLERDRVELQLARWALADGKPVLGVCRGMQIINAAAGGTLYQDCTALYPGSIKHDYFPTAGYARDYLAHELKIVPGTALHAIFQTDRVLVNSMHHQGICDLGEPLSVSAHAPDGLIEAVEHADHPFMIGVQWHPEMLIERDAGTRRLFEAFATASLRWREAQAALHPAIA